MKLDLSLIDNKITDQINLLDQLIHQLELKPVCKFKISNAENEINWERLGHPGIYLFEIQNSTQFKSFDSWSTDFLDRWEHDDYRKKFTPNSRKKRIKAHLNKHIEKWIPIYLGRAHNVGGRVRSHVYLELNKPRGALKLLARTNMYEETFRLSTISLQVVNYNVIVPRIEQLLRDRINPILGRQ